MQISFAYLTSLLTCLLDTVTHKSVWHLCFSNQVCITCIVCISCISCVLCIVVLLDTQNGEIFRGTLPIHELVFGLCARCLLVLHTNSWPWSGEHNWLAVYKLLDTGNIQGYNRLRQIRFLMLCKGI